MKAGGFLTSGCARGVLVYEEGGAGQGELGRGEQFVDGAGESPLLTEVMDDLYRSNGVLSVCASGNYAADLDQSLNLPAAPPPTGPLP